MKITFFLTIIMLVGFTSCASKNTAVKIKTKEEFILKPKNLYIIKLKKRSIKKAVYKKENKTNIYLDLSK